MPNWAGGALELLTYCTAHCSTDVRMPCNTTYPVAMGESAHYHTNADRHTCLGKGEKRQMCTLWIVESKIFFSPHICLTERFFFLRYAWTTNQHHHHHHHCYMQCIISATAAAAFSATFISTTTTNIITAFAISANSATAAVFRRFLEGLGAVVCECVCVCVCVCVCGGGGG